jgi:CheY-like chemotaxis protein
MEQNIIHGKRIFLVDDEPSVRGSFRMMLEIDDHNVTEANNGCPGQWRAGCKLLFKCLEIAPLRQMPLSSLPSMDRQILSINTLSR